jgi:hypothetical protein
VVRGEKADEIIEDESSLIIEQWLGDKVEVSVALYYECIKGVLLEVNANGVTLKEGRHTIYISWDKINFVRKRNG